MLLNHGYTDVNHKNDMNRTGYDYLTDESKQKVIEYIEYNNLKVSKPFMNEGQEFEYFD